MCQDVGEGGGEGRKGRGEDEGGGGAKGLLGYRSPPEGTLHPLSLQALVTTLSGTSSCLHLPPPTWQPPPPSPPALPRVWEHVEFTRRQRFVFDSRIPSLSANTPSPSSHPSESRARLFIPLPPPLPATWWSEGGGPPPHSVPLRREGDGRGKMWMQRRDGRKKGERWREREGA